MIYVWAQDLNGAVSLLRLPNGKLGLPFGMPHDGELGHVAAARILRDKTGLVLSGLVDAYQGILYSDIDFVQSPTKEGVVVILMSKIEDRDDIEPIHRELMRDAFMI